MPSSFAFMKTDRVTVSIEERGAGEDEYSDENPDYNTNCRIRACGGTPSPYRRSYIC